MRTRTAAVALVASVLLLTARAHAQVPVPAPVLKVALVVRVAGPALLAPGGQPSAAGIASLRAIDDSLRRLSHTGVPFALSASPVWVDELIAADQTATYAALLSVATRHPLLHTPYARAILPREDRAAAVGRELTRGEQATQRSLQTASQPILDPPDLLLSDTVLDAARATGLGAALAPADLVGDHPARVRGVTLIPVAEASGSSPADVYGTVGSIAVVAYAGPGLAATVDRLAADKRIHLVNITDLAGRAPPSDVHFDPVSPPPETYRAAMAHAQAAVDGFDSYTLPGNQTARLLGVLLARAASTADWRADWAGGSARAAAVVDLAHADDALVSASDGSVTLTSRRGAVPVTLENHASYPVRVRVRVTSPKLAFPSGAARVVTISPHGVTITFEAEARSTGSFPMDVSVSSPDASVRFAGGRVIVRSTAANVLALLLTGSGLLFLIAWSSRDMVRRRLRGRTG